MMNMNAHITPTTTNTTWDFNYPPLGYPYYSYYHPPYQPQPIDRTSKKWKCGVCGSSCSGYFSAEYAAEGLVKHQRTCKAKP